MANKQYQSASSFRNALEERLNRMAKNKGIDLMRIRRKVVFDRFIFRLLLNGDEWLVVKGGYALELRLDQARATKDIDLSIRNVSSFGTENKEDTQSEQIRRELQDAIGKPNEDFLEFAMGQAVLDLENAPYGGYRFPVEAKLAGRLFVKFNVDVAFGDVWLTPHEKIVASDWLGFAGLAPPKIPLISREQQFAEKLHAYTLPRDRTNSRVKDLVDLVLLLKAGDMNVELVNRALWETFERRATHPLPVGVPDPPAFWEKPFMAMTKTVSLRITIQGAVEKIRSYLASLN
jgi:predicted nucleotidyltransferase component of viral defense system